ncbi:52b2776b-9cea-42d6-8514-16bea3185c61 [Thermothielavioides terrestris]|uniref:52b2776b-9cea-42d6-8514-16bea3185c61 n=1 Tax=Thermothielavioides terrestris TaxID=2587410 RepID=A0A446BWI9_9PEZI|nr:52b2776b-9cea-42d6-8514-16bea3185c61 [Thermothielavioides terrestris]
MQDLAEEYKWSLGEQLHELNAGGQSAAERAYHAVLDSGVPRRVLKAATGTALVVFGAVLLYIPTVILYIIMYYRYLPELVTTVPVYLQYGVGPNPFGIASLDHLHAFQPYDISVLLTLPRSPANLERGNFMVALHLLTPDPSASSSPNLPYIPPVRPASPLGQKPGQPAGDAAAAAAADDDDDDDTTALFQPHHLQPTRPNLAAYLAAHRIQHTAARPAILPYADPLASLAARLLLLPYHVLFPARASAARLALPMAEALAFAPRRAVPRSLLLEVQGGQALQVYEVSVRFVARLRGLRWLVYRWRVAAFVLITGGMWVAEVVVLMAVLVALRLWVGKASQDRGEARRPGVRGGGGRGPAGSGESDGGDGSSGYDAGESGLAVKSSASASERRDKAEKGVKKEEEEGEAQGGGEMPLLEIPQYDAGQDAEADDEAESPRVPRRESGKGKGKEKVAAAQEEGSDSEVVGVGTSYSGPLDNAGARRRNVLSSGTSQ